MSRVVILVYFGTYVSFFFFVCELSRNPWAPIELSTRGSNIDPPRIREGFALMKHRWLLVHGELIKIGLSGPWNGGTVAYILPYFLAIWPLLRLPFAACRGPVGAREPTDQLLGIQRHPGTASTGAMHPCIDCRRGRVARHGDRIVSGWGQW